MSEYQELADFLEARFDEDDALARTAQGRTANGVVGDYAKRWRPETVQAESDARRRILEYAMAIADSTDDDYAEGRFLLEILASPYVDHPDYDDRWR